MTSGFDLRSGILFLEKIDFTFQPLIFDLDFSKLQLRFKLLILLDDFVLEQYLCIFINCNHLCPLCN